MPGPEPRGLSTTYSAAMTEELRPAEFTSIVRWVHRRWRGHSQSAGMQLSMIELLCTTVDVLLSESPSELDPWCVCRLWLQLYDA